MQEKFDEIIRDKPESSTTTNINEDALTILFGSPKSGRVIGQGRGITKSSLSIIDMSQNRMEIYEKEQYTMKKQLSEVLDLLKEHAVKTPSITYSS